ncbi:VOC family protein [Paenibacillus harenae]|uniref:3-demethylubiquinone-9 3-methyltransferase (Glyoxalase superfamily) n=1 Tax=Paenibacillus harenae TaxID=306543 RepID=A0ABT9UD42_PAEHA|nr:VOC family protein [Paenibacillus harenae]MDQ0062082.1 putative 3-demethylubiquinone-9 3-methyltransferase (glyoxalase superfamily) [Paenibacillus harenae]MDQ0116590.1 putative 3-demethylubiquinone-9 3-methyltransferase (glyoxalase superfamily) [Paenibacillus harenae]
MASHSQKMTTFLMFAGQAEAAMNDYVSIFDESEVISIIRYGAEGPGDEGTVMHALFTLKGQQFMCIDSSVNHAFTFTPAISIFVTCDTDQEIDEVFRKLSDGGSVLMPLSQTPVSKQFGWVQDKYGVSWQLNLPNQQ